MFNPIDFLFKKRIASVLGVDIGTESIKIAELRREDQGRFRLLNYSVMESVGGGESGDGRGLSFDLGDEEIANRIRALIKEGGFSTDAAVMSLPVFSTFVTVMDMPVTEEKELSSAVPLQAREYIPIPLTEVVLDWKLIKIVKKSDLIRAEAGREQAVKNEAKDAAASGSLPEKKADDAGGEGGGGAKSADSPGRRAKPHSEVLLMAAPREMVQKYVRIAQLSKLTLLGLEIETFALARSAVADPAVPVLLLDIGARSSSIAVFDDGFLRIVHGIGVSSLDLTRACSRALGTDLDRAQAHKERYGLYASGGEAEIVTAYLPLLEALARDCERVLSAYWRMSGRQITHVALSGSAALLKGLDAYLAGRLHLETHLANPFAKTMLPKDLVPAAPVLGPQFANAIGLAMKEI